LISDFSRSAMMGRNSPEPTSAIEPGMCEV
jgi:hypothetical protein